MKSAESEIIGTVEDAAGRTRDTRYDLLFTTTKVIAAIVLHQLHSGQFENVKTVLNLTLPGKVA